VQSCRRASCALQSGVEVPCQAIRQQIAPTRSRSSESHRPTRDVHEVIRVRHYNGARDGYESQWLFTNEQRRPGAEGVDDTATSED